MDIYSSAVSYLKDAKIELSKVTWPTKKQATQYSLLVIGVCLVVSVVFMGLDYVFNQGLDYLVKLTSSY
ncbi:MAG: preprotein translocase subunit SecE [bacterium]